MRYFQSMYANIGIFKKDTIEITRQGPEVNDYILWYNRQCTARNWFSKDKRPPNNPYSDMNVYDCVHRKRQRHLFQY